jgi:hypothetical protein
MLLKLLLDTRTLGDLLFMLPKENFGEAFSDPDATEDDRIDALAEDIRDFYNTVGVQEDQIVGTEYEAETMARHWIEKRL